MNSPLSQNHYLYTHGNPVMNIDPSGNMVGINELTFSISMRGQLSANRLSRVGTSLSKYRKRTWIVYRVDLPNGVPTFEHTYIWVKNRKTNIGIGYHILANPRDMLKTVRKGVIVPGTLNIVLQPRVNFYAGRTYPIRSKRSVARLGDLAYGLLHYRIASTMQIGDSCHWDYHIPNSHCIKWTDDAVIYAKLLARLPI
jgi:hypothetical protein